MADTSAPEVPGVEKTPEWEKQYLKELSEKPLPTRLKGYVALTGPGWLQSAITLGGGSLTGGLYLGVLAGFSMLWLQPLAMILGVVMLSAIGYVTLSTGERPFRAINRHVNPVLGWSWLVASLLANMVWCLPQYSLATGVLQQNLLPDLLGPDGTLGEYSTGIIVGSILVVTTIVTWSYGSGHWGVRLYERMIKLMVAVIVLCFIGVVIRLAVAAEGLDWSGLFAGYIPDFGALFRPADGFAPLLEELPSAQQHYWTDFIVNKQRDVVMTAFATAVGINMTFLLPYSMLAREWGREHRGLAIFDLSTGMFIPFMLATSCVVIASANRFYTDPYPGLVGTEWSNLSADATPAETEFAQLLKGRIRADLRSEHGPETAEWTDEQWQQAIQARIPEAGITESEERLAATLVTRDVQALADSLAPLLQSKLFSDVVFGLGVLGMALSTITLLMLISGFVVCEVLNVPATGWPHRLGTLLAATGALGPFFWSKAKAWLAVPTSVFGLMLLPIAYLTFLLLINQKTLLGDARPKGIKRLLGNVLMTVATAVAIFASAWAVWSKAGWYGIGGMAVFVAAIVIAHVLHTPEGSRE